MINEYVFEIRFKPNPNVLDNRGVWSYDIIDLLNLTEWRIIENRIDIYDREETINVFVSFKNAGLVMRNISNQNEFKNNSNKLIKYLLTQKPFGYSIDVSRIGVRSRFANDVKSSFDDLFKLYSEKIIKITPEFLEIFNANLIDIGSPLSFEGEFGSMNVRSGPMKFDQLDQFFKIIDSDDDKSFAFLEIDYYKKFDPPLSMHNNQIIEILNNLSSSNWGHNKKFVARINEFKK